MQAGFVKPDDLSAVVRLVDIMVSVLTPTVFKLKGQDTILAGYRIESLCSLGCCRRFPFVRWARCADRYRTPPAFDKHGSMRNLLRGQLGASVST